LSSTRGQSWRGVILQKRATMTPKGMQKLQAKTMARACQYKAGSS
jgi:hypothetical protein